MDKLEKAILQEHLTSDTVGTQLCSNWLKNEIKLLFKQLEEKILLLKICKAK